VSVVAPEICFCRVPTLYGASSRYLTVTALLPLSIYITWRLISTSTFLFLHNIAPLQIKRSRHGCTASPHLHPRRTQPSVVLIAAPHCRYLAPLPGRRHRIARPSSNRGAAQTGNPGRPVQGRGQHESEIKARSRHRQ
jgi:hypothetical protein